MKKIISLLLSVAVIASVAVSSVGNASAKSKKFYANKKSVTVTSGKKTTVKITSKKGKKLTFTIANGSICTAKFGKWNGKKITLKITGLMNGKTKITVKNKKTKKKIKISVTVKGGQTKSTSSAKPKVNLVFPSTPFTIRNYGYRDELKDTVVISDVWTEITYYSYNEEASVKLWVRGTKTFSSESSNTSSSVWIPWKAYNSNNIVVDSDEILSTDIAVGESFESYDYVDHLYPGKTYTIKFLDSAR
jgi:hypothetical protein